MAVVQIPNLPASIALNGNEPLEIVQSGQSRRCSVQQIANLGVTVTSSQIVENISNLRSLSIQTKTPMFIEGYYNKGDGGGGYFYGIDGRAPGTYVDNGGTIIVPIGGDGGSAWIRFDSEDLSVKYFGAVGDGITDDTSSINNALYSGAGGSVYIPEGNYKISGTLNVYPSTTLFGVGACDDLIPLAGGSNISVTHTSSVGVLLGRGATINGLNFWYPNQVTTTSPIVYDYTIASNTSDSYQGGNNAGITIENIVIHNAYNGILLNGDYTDGSPNTGAVIINKVRMYAINIGYNLVTTASEINVSDCVCSPLFWSASTNQPIRSWVINNGTACWLNSSGQGAQFSNCTFFGHRRGIYLYNPLVPSLSRAQNNFMKVTGCIFDGLKTCIEVTDKFGFGGALFTGCMFLAKNPYDPSVNDCIAFYSNNSSNLNYVQFNGCFWGGAAGNHVYINNDPLTTAYSWYQFTGNIFFTANAYNSAGSYYNIYVNSVKSSVLISGCQFQNVYQSSVTKIKIVSVEALNVTNCDIFDGLGLPFDVASSSSRIEIKGNTVRSYINGIWPSTPSTVNAIASATNVSLGESDVGIYIINGSVQIESIYPSWPGRIATLKFTNSPLIVNGNNLKLSANFSATNNDTLSIICDGTNWYEISRSVN